MHIVLVEPEIPPNTGNVARLCVGTETHLHLVGPLGFSIDDRQLKRAGLDYWPLLKLHQYDSLEEFFKKLPADARFYLASTKAKTLYTQVRYQAEDYILFGRETRGLPEGLVLKNLDKAITIPMWGPSRSINLSNSVAIVLYEALRQIKHFPAE